MAVLDHRHPTIPDGFGSVVAGTLVNLEVDDVDEVYERLVVSGPLEAVLDLRSEAFGQRHFIVRGPGMSLVDVITEIEPEAELAAGSCADLRRSRRSRTVGRRTKAQSLLTRDALERAARELFLEQGYDGVTLEDVAARAGVTRGALYHHFGSKHGLFEAVTLTVHAEVAAHVLGAAEAAGEGWPGIEAGCWAFLESAASPNVQRILLVDAPVVLGWQHWRSMDAANSRRLLEEGLIEMESAGLLGVDARAAAVLISGALNEGALWLAQNPDDDAATQVRTAVQQMLRALRASGGDSGS